MQKRKGDLSLSGDKKFISNDIFVGVFLSIVSLVFLVQALRFPGQAFYFPSIALGLMLFFSIWVVFLGIWKTIKVRQGKADYRNQEIKKRSFLIFASIGVYVFCIQKLGFFSASALYMPCCMLLFGQRKIKLIVFTTVGVLAFLYWLFVIQLHVYMPRGILF